MKDYTSPHAVSYEQPPRYSFTELTVLPFLVGRPWDEVALSFVHSLRPSSIRVTTGCVTSDSRPWRVTVFVSDKNIIRQVTQECEVGVYDPITDGHHLNVALNQGLGSAFELFLRQDRENPIVCLSYMFGETTKTLRDGSSLTFKPDAKTKE